MRRAFSAKGAHNGFVAIDQRNGAPCYVQWLFGARDNAFVAQLKGFPVLAPHQALLENAYTPPACRGFVIMSAAMALIAGRAADIGARHVLTFVGARQHRVAERLPARRLRPAAAASRDADRRHAAARPVRGVAGGRPAPDGEDLNRRPAGSDPAPGRRFRNKIPCAAKPTELFPPSPSPARTSGNPPIDLGGHMICRSGPGPDGGNTSG